jgi:hypothetical protein
VTDTTKKFFGLEVGAWLQMFIMATVTFGAYYVSNEVAPLRVWQETTAAWKEGMDERAQECKVGMETNRVQHESMTALISSMQQNLKSFVDKEQLRLELSLIQSKLTTLEKEVDRSALSRHTHNGQSGVQK